MMPVKSGTLAIYLYPKTDRFYPMRIGKKYACENHFADENADEIRMKNAQTEEKN